MGDNIGKIGVASNYRAIATAIQTNMSFTSNKSSFKLAILYLAAGILWTSVGQGQVPDFAHLDRQLRATIKDKSTSDSVLRESISRLGRFTESPGFWTEIANDPSYSLCHRTRAVFALFRRHGEWSGEPRSLGKCLAPAKWLNESSIERVTYVLGYLPTEVNPGESVYSITVLSGPKIYIRMRSEVDEETFHALLRGKNVPDLKTEPTILQFGYGDDYDEWLRNVRSK